MLSEFTKTLFYDTCISLNERKFYFCLLVNNLKLWQKLMGLSNSWSSFQIIYNTGMLFHIIQWSRKYYFNWFYMNNYKEVNRTRTRWDANINNEFSWVFFKFYCMVNMALNVSIIKIAIINYKISMVFNLYCNLLCFIKSFVEINPIVNLWFGLELKFPTETYNSVRHTEWN